MNGPTDPDPLSLELFSHEQMGPNLAVGQQRRKPNGGIPARTNGGPQAMPRPAQPPVSGGSHKSQASRLVELVLGCELFHTPDSEAFANITVDAHRETWPVRSRGFRRWLQQRYYSVDGRAPSGQAVQEAQDVLEGQALYAGPLLSVHVRVAEADGDVYLDLADEAWRMVRISSNGWGVVDAAPVRFRRPRGMHPLPVPETGGDLNQLRQFLSAEHQGFVLTCAYLVASLRPRGPFPVLQFVGEQGSGKSTNARVVKSLVDPSTAQLRAEPKDLRDVMIAARNGWVLAFDNLSGIRIGLSDAFCRLSTGGGFATRELYTDSEEVLFDATRPLLLNGISEVATRSDLLDRVLAVRVPQIEGHRRLSEREFWHRFDDARPRILGALLDAVAAGLRNLPRTNVASRPRMADFVLWIVAAEEALPWSPGDFLAAYSESRASAHDVALDASPIGALLLQLVERGPFVGTASELLQRLARIGAEPTRQSGWPKSPNQLSAGLRRIAPDLRAVGVRVEFQRTEQQRLIVLSKTEKWGRGSSTASSSS